MNGERAGATAGPLVVAVGALAVLVASGRALPAPPVDDLGPWLERVGPVVAAASLLRVVAVAAAVVLLAASVLRLAAGAAGAVRVAAAVDRALPPPLRRALGAVAGVGTAGSVLLGVGVGPGPSAASGGPAPEVTATLAVVPTATLRVLDPPPPPASGPVEATMRVLPDPSTVTAPAAADDEWVVAPGDSFWSIAEEVVADELGRPGTDDEVGRYWRRLVGANGDRLATGDADLIYPGQRLRLVPPG